MNEAVETRSRFTLRFEYARAFVVGRSSSSYSTVTK